MLRHGGQLDDGVTTGSFVGGHGLSPLMMKLAGPRSDNKVFEYACHEANYALEGIMKGARLLEADFRGEDPEGVVNPTR